MLGRATLPRSCVTAAVSVLLTLAASAEVDQNHLRQVQRANVERQRITNSSRSAAAFLEGRLDMKFLRLTGTVRDVFRDETNPEYTFIILACDDGFVYAVFRGERDKEDWFKGLVEAEVSVFGFCDAYVSDKRRYQGRFLYIYDLKDIQILKPPTADRFAVPSVGNLEQKDPLSIAALGRRRMTGKVLATWQPASVLLQTPDKNAVARIELADDRLPAYGSCIDVVGNVETDIHHINLSRAIWRPATNALALADVPATNVTAREILCDSHGEPCINPSFHGKTVRLSGRVLSVSSDGHRLIIDNGGLPVSVVFSEVPSVADALETGSTVEVTGACVMDVPNGRPADVFPRIRGFFVVLRNETDFRLLARPSPWTPRLLGGVLAALFVAFLGILAWNVLLRQLVARKAREVIRAKTAELASALRTDERTRLATELHDSLSQNLTAIALQISSAEHLQARDPAASSLCLTSASRMLESSHAELRRCLWDLRSDILEEPDLCRAVRKTLDPVIGPAALDIALAVSRARLSDLVAHNVLSIVRELSVNAVRHGHATQVKVDGSLRDDVLRVSVRDNGRGFDAMSCPGPSTGHYGLEGIRARIRRLDGSFRIESEPGHGTLATFSIRI